jgi:hypothetical protein
MHIREVENFSLTLLIFYFFNSKINIQLHLAHKFSYSCSKQNHRNDRKSVHNLRHNRSSIRGKKIPKPDVSRV